ncbi:MAG TPA: YfhO family protein [Gemmatimonadaceae bacterium]|nr:YfhO family protein [Gemmatimonadaceae bacterium]
MLLAPRFATAWAALVYAAATLSLAYPALAGRFLVSLHSDQYFAGYAFREYAASSLKAGHGFPQWNPYLQGGLPYIAAMHGDIFYPTFLLRMVLPTDAAMTWGFAIHLFLAGLFTFGFLRAYGVGFWGSLVGGLAYMMSGPIAGYASPGHDGKLFVSALLPLALWMLVRGVRDGRAWSWGVLAITVALAVLSPHPQLLQYLLLTSGAFALYIALAPNVAGKRMQRDVVLKRLGLAFGAVILGGIIGAVQYLPVREYVAWSPRAGGKGWRDAVSYSMPPEELFNAILPQFSGVLENYWGRNLIHWHSEYAGVVVLILAGAGLFAANVRKSFRWFWGGTFIVSLLWALGGYTPFFYLVYYLVPGTKYFRAPSTIMYITMFSVSVFAALGVDRIVRAPESLARKFTWGWAIGVVAVCVLLAATMSSVAESITNSLASAGYRSDMLAGMLERARANEPHVALGAIRTVLFALLALGVIWAARTRLESRQVVAWALVALVAIDLWTVERHYWIFSAPAKQLYASDPAIDAIRASDATDPGRVFVWDPLRSSEERDPYFGTSPDQNYDGMMVHRVRSVTGYHGNQLGRYDNLLEGAFESGAYMSPPFWRHENVRFLYTTLPDSLMPQLTAQLRLGGRFVKIAGPVRNAAGSTVYAYTFPGSNPAAWVASVMVKGPDDQALATVLNPAFDPTRAAIIDTAAALQTVQPTTVPPPSNVQARVTRMQPGEIDVQLEGSVAAGSALIVSENFFPGWRAAVDGKSVSSVRANYNLIGVPLSPGARNVTLRFVDRAYQTGKTVTPLALLVAIAAVAAGIVADRRRVQPV